MTLVPKTWVRPRAEWDHDHCAFCWAKFADVDGPEILREGYATPDDYYWICPTCFTDFREQSDGSSLASELPNHQVAADALRRASLACARR